MKASRRFSQAMRLAQVVRDPQRKGLLRILYEAGRCAIREREVPAHYFTRLLYKQGLSDGRDYIGNGKVVRLRSRIYDPQATEFLSNKVLFHLHFERVGIRVPTTYAYSVGDRVFARDGDLPITGVDEFRAVLRRFLEMAPGPSLFVKSAYGIGGKGCYRVLAEDVDTPAMEELFAEVRSGVFLFQETLVQHPEVDRVYPNSINTLRIDTYVEGGRAEVISALLRFGADGRFVDNISSGGCFVSVDLDTGRLRSTAMKFYEHGGNTYLRHPDTDFPFEGFLVPHIQEAQDLVRAAALVCGNRLVGWDVAITRDGPVLMEGNHDYHIPMSEMAFGGYRRQPLFRKILQEYL